MRFGPHRTFVILVEAVLMVTSVATAGELSAQPKTPIPDAQAQQTAKKAAGELFTDRFTQAKTTAEKTALATDMMDAAAKVQAGSADQYVLLKIALDVAAGTGDAATALQAVERLLEQFDEPAAELIGETLLTAARQATTSAQHKAVAEAALSIAGKLSDADQYETALRLCEAARSSAQRAKLFPLAKELTAQIEETKRQQLLSEDYRKALSVLEDKPTDPEANLAAGRHLCFVKGNWERGVPMLALGSDAALKAAAIKDLRGANSADEQAVIGDAWWDLAEAKQGEERDTLRLRAGFWYRQAEPKLAGGLAALKIRQRLEELSKSANSDETKDQGDGRVQVVCEWQRFADSKPLPNLKLLSNGRIDSPSGPAVWCQRERILLTLWLAQKPPGSVFDMAILSPEGTTYSATNSWGGQSSGRLLRGTNLMEKPYLVNVPSDERMVALVKDLDTLLGKWDRRNTNSAYEAIWTFCDDGTVTSTSGALKGTWWIGSEAVRVIWGPGQWDTFRRPLGGGSVTGDSWAGPGVVLARKIP